MRAHTAYVSMRRTLKSPFLYRLLMGKLLVLKRKQKWRSGFSSTYLCIFSNVWNRENTLKSPFLYGLSIEKLLVISRKQKWRSGSSRTCLYNVCKRGKGPNIAIPVWASCDKVVWGRNRHVGVELWSLTDYQQLSHRESYKNFDLKVFTKLKYAVSLLRIAPI